MPYKTVKKPNSKVKTYTITFDAFSSSEFEAKKTETIEELKSQGLDESKLQEEIGLVIASEMPQISLNATIQEPQFKELALGLGALITASGNMDFASSGKVIFDTCCIDYDAELDANPRAMIKLCMELATDYVMPISADIKKN